MSKWNRTNSIVATVQMQGMKDLEQITIPLYKRELHPGKFDIIHSLRKLPQLQKSEYPNGPPIHYFKKITKGPRLPKDEVISLVGRDNSHNLLSPEGLAEWWAYYDGKSATGNDARRYTLYVYDSVSKDYMQCTICDQLTAHIDTRPEVMLPFCENLDCWQHFEATQI